jgi:hypothetical protein
MSSNDVFAPIELISPDMSGGLHGTSLEAAVKCDLGYVCKTGQVDV